MTEGKEDAVFVTRSTVRVGNSTVGVETSELEANIELLSWLDLEADNDPAGDKE